MPGRTFAIGDIHGELGHLGAVLARLPALERSDTLVFLGDYVDRGPDSRDVIEFLRELPAHTPARVVCLRGNHEDAWLRVIEHGWDEFVLPPANGCRATVHSFLEDAPPIDGRDPHTAEMLALTTGAFFPPEVVAWMQTLPFWYEDEHGIYVHAGLPAVDGRFAHPAEVENPLALIWTRKEAFIRGYEGKHVIFGHTPTRFLPQELSAFTPDDPTDLWSGPHATGIDTGCGAGGFLTALELPAMTVYESRA
ncbi:MAG: serine/threonine protein phosphatase [Opitutaceae bacterium]|nr:serine/threonine protein phosphatase [Opitutaceae bacterium]